MDPVNLLSLAHAEVAVIGSAGQAGLLAAHGLLRAGYQVALYSDRSPEQWLNEGRPTGTAVRFARSLAYERELELDHGHAQAPKMEGLRVTIRQRCKAERCAGRFRAQPRAHRHLPALSQAMRVARALPRAASE